MNRPTESTVAPDAAAEILIVSRDEQGFRVYSPANPGNQFLVGGNPEHPICTCEEYAWHAGDQGMAWHKPNPDYRCPHINAVLSRLNENGEANGGQYPPSFDEGPTPEEERAAIQNEGRLPGETVPAMPLSDPSLMTFKRSVSPDGRIDSLSVEIAVPALLPTGVQPGGPVSGWVLDTSVASSSISSPEVTAEGMVTVSVAALPVAEAAAT